MRSLTQLRLSAAAERVAERTRFLRGEPMHRRELLVDAVCALGVLAVAVGLPVAAGAPVPPAGPAVALVIALAVVSRVEFDVGSGVAMPLQLVFVPALFLAGPAWAPALVVAGFVAARLPDMAREHGRVPRHAMVEIGNGWFAVGPAVVLTAAGVQEPLAQHALVLVAALAAMFAADTLAAALRAWALEVPPLQQLRMMGVVFLVDAMLAPIGLLAAVVEQRAAYAFLLVLPLAGLLAVFARERNARIDQQIELSTAYRGTAMLLAEVITADDAYTGDHSHGVLELALTVADELGVDPDERRLVELGALLHDVGKIAVPDAILNKPGPLDDAEWAVMREHTVVGQRMLDKVGGALTDVGAVVRASHEHWDGGGYPDGLAEERIPRAARIVAAADAYSAMTTNRSYRPALGHQAAVDELVRCAGTQFDPTVVVALVTVLRRHPRAAGHGRPRLSVVA